jgi:hypothetical protein
MQDWEKDAINELKYYEARKMALENIALNIRSLELKQTAIRSASTDSTPVAGGGNGWEQNQIDLMTKIEKEKKNLEADRLQCERIKRALAALTADDRRVLELFYIHPGKGAVDRLSDELNISIPNIYRKRDAALYRFTISLHGFRES